MSRNPRQYENKPVEKFDPNKSYEWRDSFASNQEFISDYLHRKPTHDIKDYFLAIADSFNKDYPFQNESPIVEITSDMVGASYSSSSNAGVAVGAVQSKKKEITLMTFKNSVRKYDITRMTTDGTLVVVGDRSVQTYGASIKDVASGRTFGARPFDHLPNRSNAARTAPTISPEEALAREKLLEAQTKELEVEEDLLAKLDTKIGEFTNALVIAEIRGLQEINTAKGIRGSDLTYPQNKHIEVHPQDLDEYYKNAFAMPRTYNFLSLPDPSTQPDVKKIMGFEHEQVLARARKINEFAETNLETLAAHLKVVDYNTSPSDDEHPLIVAYEEEFGPIRELTAKERQRIDMLEGKAPPVPDDKKQFDNNGKEIQPPFFGDDIFVGSLKISDFGNPDAPLSSGQVFYASKNYKEKYNIQNNSLMGTVNVVGGDPHADVIDEIFIVEGAATAASLKEMMDESDRLGLSDYKSKNILVLSAYNAANFVASTKELHHKYPDIPVNAVSDQDIKVKLEGGGGRPELDEKGGYLYLTRDGGGPLSKDQLPKTQEEQKNVLVLNQGADAAFTINQYVIDNPNKDADGKILLPQTSAFVINKGKGGLGSQIIPQLSPETDGKTVHERRLPPKVDVNDLLERSKKVVEQSLINFNKQLKAEDKPQMTVSDRTYKLKQALSQVLVATITTPAAEMREAVQRKVASNIDDNHYQREAERKAAEAEQALADREALKETRRQERASRSDYSNTKNDNHVANNDDATTSSFKVDKIRAGERDPELNSLANKYGGNFMSQSERNTTTSSQDLEHQKSKERTLDTPANDEVARVSQPPTPAYANTMRP